VGAGIVACKQPAIAPSDKHFDFVDIEHFHRVILQVCTLADLMIIVMQHKRKRRLKV
jgi:hypothetical protein